MLVYIHTGSLCNSQCPDELIPGEPTSNKWHIGVKLAIVVLVVGLSITCIVIKWMFFVWLHHVEKKLNSYLHSFDNKLESSNRVIPQVNRSTIWEGPCWQVQQNLSGFLLWHQSLTKCRTYCDSSSVLNADSLHIHLILSLIQYLF